MEELERVPHAAYSLRQEHEIKLPACAVDELSSEPELADGCITASTYTARTLVENGIDPSRIAVVPYGVDFSRFPARSQMRTGREPFTVMFLGSLGQRKGLSYLLEAVLALGTKQICVKLRGRGLIDQRLLSAYPVAKLDVKTDLRREDIVRDLHSSDLLVLPSITEGFAQVILEAMSCGVPVLATENTCAPDVITNGLDGFCIPIRSTGAIASKLEWAVTNRDTLVEMGIRAAARARQYTWPRFRAQLREAYMAGRRSASAAA